MTAPLTPEHPRWEHAQRFGRELRVALSKRKIRPFQIYKQTGGGWSYCQFHSWLAGSSLPRLDRAIKLAEVLDWPQLSIIVREARTSTCQRPGCGRTFISEAGHVRKYCSARCRQLVHDYDLRYTHATRKKVVTEDELEHRVQQFLAEQAAQHDELLAHRTAVASMCNDCEPEGYCRTADCPLRSVSPLPLQRTAPPSTDKRLVNATGRRWTTPIRRAS